MQNCSCWRCWLQSNATIILLFALVLISLGVTIGIMHEARLPDEYAKWAQGFTAGLLSSLTLAMNVQPRPANHQDNHETKAPTGEEKK